MVDCSGFNKRFQLTIVILAYGPSHCEKETESGKLEASQDFLASSRTKFQNERFCFVKLSTRDEAKSDGT